MRALTHDERYMLAVMASDAASGFHWNDDDPEVARWDAAHSSLVARGCATLTIEQNPVDDEYEETEVYAITDLGRLALRVSLPSPT